MGKRLYKTSEGAMLAGVCAGLSEYLSIDVTLVRLAFVIISLMGGAGVLGYIIAAIIMPDKWQVADGSRQSWKTTTDNFGKQEETHTEGVHSDQSEYRSEPVFEQVRAETVVQDNSGGGQRFVALILIAVGSYMLLERYFKLSYWARFWIRDWWPVIPLALGVILLINSMNRPKKM